MVYILAAWVVKTDLLLRKCITVGAIEKCAQENNICAAIVRHGEILLYGDPKGFKRWKDHHGKASSRPYL